MKRLFGAAPSRRTFLKTTSLASGGLVIAFLVPSSSRLAFAAEPEKKEAPLPEPNAFLRIGEDESVTVLLAHSEMGQGIWTGLAMLIAEELDADWSRMRVEHAPAAPAYAHTAFGVQLTGGSSTTWSEFMRYRQAGALGRALLRDAAAKKFGVEPSEVRMEKGVATAGTHRATYGELAAAAATLPTPNSVTLKKPEAWTIIGKRTLRLDTPEKISGRAQFGMDVQFPGLLTAVVARPPVFGGKVRSFDASAATKVPGVMKVVEVPSGVAVVAKNFWAASQGRDALKIDWDRGEAASLDSDELRKSFSALASKPGMVAATAGDAKGALASTAKSVDVEYAVPYLAHAPMEPLNCTVKIEKDRCDIWAGTQFQTMDQGIGAGITGLPPEKVHIHTTFLGGGFGRRATTTSDAVTEALHVAKAAGAPVKTVWTREDDIRGGYYRSAFVHRVRAGVGDDGLPSGWHHRIVGQSIVAGTPFEPMLVKDGIDSTSVEGVSDSPYMKSIANHRVELHSPKTAIPVLWWRSVGHSHTAFVMETMIDELAALAGKDPVEYRRILLKDHPRSLRVLNAAAEKAKWGSPLPEGRARGVAVHESFGSFVAQVAEVSLEKGNIRVHKVVCAIDCGLAVNPEGVEAQMESGIAFGLSAALHSSLHLKKGEVQESNFHDYVVLRMDEMPKVETHIVASGEPMGGVGEVAVPPIAPAVANAVAALTGKRLRELPLRLG